MELKITSSSRKRWRVLNLSLKETVLLCSRRRYPGSTRFHNAVPTAVFLKPHLLDPGALTTGRSCSDGGVYSTFSSRSPALSPWPPRAVALHLASNGLVAEDTSIWDQTELEHGHHRTLARKDCVTSGI